MSFRAIAKLTSMVCRKGNGWSGSSLMGVSRSSSSWQALRTGANLQGVIECGRRPASWCSRCCRGPSSSCSSSRRRWRRFRRPPSCCWSSRAGVASAPNWSGGGNGVGEDGRVGGGAVASRFYGGQEVGVLQWRLEAQERVLYARMVEGGGLASSINFLFTTSGVSAGGIESETFSGPPPPPPPPRLLPRPPRRKQRKVVVSVNAARGTSQQQRSGTSEKCVGLVSCGPSPP